MAGVISKEYKNNQENRGVKMAKVIFEEKIMQLAQKNKNSKNYTWRKKCDQLKEVKMTEVILNKYATNPEN